MTKDWRSLKGLDALKKIREKVANQETPRVLVELAIAQKELEEAGLAKGRSAGATANKKKGDEFKTKCIDAIVALLKNPQHSGSSNKEILNLLQDRFRKPDGEMYATSYVMKKIPLARRQIHAKRRPNQK